MRPTIVVVALVLAIAVACGGGDGNGITATPARTGAETPTPAGETPQSSPSATVIFTNDAGDEVELQVEIADDQDERARGLMFRDSLAENRGMLFLYEEDHIGSFWMKDTLIPLSIAFVAADGTIIDIQDMEPETTDAHRPPDLYRNAIEVNQGWFERSGVAIGDTVALPGA